MEAFSPDQWLVAAARLPARPVPRHGFPRRRQMEAPLPRGSAAARPGDELREEEVRKREALEAERKHWEARTIAERARDDTAAACAACTAAAAGLRDQSLTQRTRGGRGRSPDRVSRVPTRMRIEGDAAVAVDAHRLRSPPAPPGPARAMAIRIGRRAAVAIVADEGRVGSLVEDRQRPVRRRAPARPRSAPGRPTGRTGRRNKPDPGSAGRSSRLCARRQAAGGEAH